MSSDLARSPLASQACGSFCCAEVTGDDASTSRLKRLGVCQGQTIELVQAGDPMIVRVAGSRLGLSRHLAERVLVTPLTESAAVEV